MMKLRFGDDDEDDTWMRCPACGSTELHHYNVEVYRRDHDGATSGLHVITFQRGGATVNTSMDGNPSPRGNGIRVHLTCQKCPALVELVIVHDEGGTYIETDTVGSRRQGGDDE
jgi:hypothetical protein